MFNMATTKPDQLTASKLPLMAVRILIATAQRATIPARCVSDECSQDLPLHAKRVEYNLFHSAAADDHVPLIALEEADRDWLDSMEAEGWPVLPPDLFKRHFIDSGDNVARPEVPLLYTAVAAPTESTKLVRAAA
jgi:hypothetical protein